MSGQQTNLFDSYESVKTKDIVSTSVKISKEDSGPLKKLKSLFNSRMNAIRKLEADIKRLDGIFNDLNDLHLKESRKKEEQVIEVRLQLMEKLHVAYNKKSFSKDDKAFLLDLILENYNEVLADESDIDLSRYDKYKDLMEEQIMSNDFEMSMMEDMLKATTGLDNLNLKDLMGEEKLNEEDFAEKYFNDESQHDDNGTDTHSEKNKGNEKSFSSTDSNNVEFDKHFITTYKKLAKRIHPDLEVNESIKAEKELLMKELVVAKETRDLFKLISIQSQVDQIEFGENKIDEKYLTEYAEVLLEQKKELSSNIYMLKNHSGRSSWLYQNFYHNSKKGKMKKFQQYNILLSETIEELEELMETLGTVKATKQYIRESQEDDLYFF